MKKLSTPTLAAISATRTLLGLGAGLLLARGIPLSRRRKVGWTLVGIGAASSVPLAVLTFRRG